MNDKLNPCLTCQLSQCLACGVLTPPWNRRVANGKPQVNIELEMRALDAEKLAMEAFNEDRRANGYALGYDSNSFFELAEKYRALKDKETT